MGFLAGMSGLGKSLPEKIVTNEDLVASGLDTSHDWIVERTGIESRRLADTHETSLDFGYGAAKQAIENAHLSPVDIDLIIVATSTPQHRLFPSNACLLQDRLGLRHIGAFDLSAACSGFGYALHTAAQFVATGSAKHVLVVATDCLSKYVDWSDRSICILFGDGAGAAVISPTKAGYGIVSSSLFSNGHYASILGFEDPFIFMKGQAVFKVAIDAIVPSLQALLQDCSIGPDAIRYFVPHQANLRIIDYTAQKLGFKKDQVISNIHKYGNTSSASIPLALAELAEQSRLQEGDYVLTVGFGAGFTWGTTLIRWGGIRT